MYRLIDFSTFLFGYERTLFFDKNKCFVLSIHSKGITYYLNFLQDYISLHHKDASGKYYRNSELIYCSDYSKKVPFLDLNKLEQLINPLHTIYEKELQLVKLIPSNYKRKVAIYSFNGYSIDRSAIFELDDNWNLDVKSLYPYIRNNNFTEEDWKNLYFNLLSLPQELS